MLTDPRRALDAHTRPERAAPAAIIALISYALDITWAGSAAAHPPTSMPWA